MRYEVRIYNLEEFIPENRMTYTPCEGREEAKEKYIEYLGMYDDPNHEVELCRVDYTMYGERVTVLASTRNPDPYFVTWEGERLAKPGEDD